jgi:UDP-N-acetylmuramyl pentapeptide phosphotransferase/UDP-N-acetylglucosamine-1-phosphate transferase
VNSILIIILNILLIFFLNNFFLKKNILVDKKQLAHKSFASKDLVPISGGFLIFANLLFFSNNYLANVFLFALFFLGVFSDLLIIKSPLKKFIIQIFIIILFLFSLKISIISTKVPFIDLFIENKLFAILFTAFCLLILINGSNFLDGINTLVCGYYIIVTLAILYVGYYNKINYNFLEFYYLLIVLFIIFFFNFFSKTYLGDSGTFLLSFLIGYYLINLCNINLYSDKYISPIFILLLLWYPAFENLFSIIRKILNKKNPSAPDNLHFHHLLFLYFEKICKKKIYINSLTGIAINLYNLLVFLVGVQFYFKTNFLFILVAFNIFVYTFFYILLLNKIKPKIKK